MLFYLCGFLFVGTMSCSNRIELPEDDMTGLSQEDLGQMPTPIFRRIKGPDAKMIKRPAASILKRPAASTCVDHGKIKRSADSTHNGCDNLHGPLPL